MTTNECKAVRREIDEADPDGQPRVATTEHLRSCPQCRTFRSERQALQSLMANLNTVEAPADFYFRLRGRLARSEKSGSVVGSRFSLVARTVAAVALVSMLLLAGVVVKNRMTTRDAVANKPGQKSVSEQGNGAVKEEKLPPAPKEAVTAGLGGNNERSGNGETKSPRRLAVPIKYNAPQNNSTVAQKVEGRAVRESAGSGAAVLTKESTGSVVLVPLDARALRISIDNGRGSARTISLPTVSFGSQRLMAREAFLSPLSPAKSSW